MPKPCGFNTIPQIFAPCKCFFRGAARFSAPCAARSPPALQAGRLDGVFHQHGPRHQAHAAGHRSDVSGFFRHGRKVHIAEVKRRLSVSESAAAQIRQPNSLDVINLCEGEADEESTLSISAKGMTFEFKTQRPEESVIFILSRMRGDVI